MAENSSIGWTHHTFNIVWGCAKVSEACKNCYAEAWANRTGNKGLWGLGARRRTLTDSYWKQPLRWDRAAALAGERHRVFCSSMADVFEDHPTVAQERDRLWPLIAETPHLDWLLLTKRPENTIAFAPRAWADRWPDNVWAGTTVETQARLDERVPHLLRVPARVRFLSSEPLLERLALAAYLRSADCACSYYRTGEYMAHSRDCRSRLCAMAGGIDDCAGELVRCGCTPPISWVIVGGESGPGARPFDLAWAREIVRECGYEGVPVFVKQLGAVPIDSTSGSAERLQLVQAKGEDINEFPPELRRREFPRPVAEERPDHA